MNHPFPSRVNVLGVGVHAINMDSAMRWIHDALRQRRKGYVCVTGVHGIMEAQNDPKFRHILNNSFLTTPDGMPTVWVGKKQGAAGMERVFGPDLMSRVCSETVEHGYTHFLYGGAPGVADELKARLEERYPGIRVAGTYTPPFRPLTLQEHVDLVEQISNVQPDIIWVGLSTPKQERFMAEYLPKLNTTLMFGVGAAFDLHTGRMKDSPEWMKNAGLQWLHRLAQDPQRLWKRYLVNNPKFIAAISAQMLGMRRYELSNTPSEEPLTHAA